MIALITPTGGRPDQIKICARLMKQQTYKGKVAWIIVDDCVPRTTDFITGDFREGWSIYKSYPKPAWSPGFNSQARNLSVAINIVLGLKDVEAIFIIEDDDYYRPIYLEVMMSLFSGYTILGEQNTIYYNVMYRRYNANGNFTHSSLFQTAIKPAAIKAFRNCFHSRFIDAHFYHTVRNHKVKLFRGRNLSIGVKGMPGRGGIGAGHGRQMAMRPDPDMNYLRSLIGTDTRLYERFYRPIGNRPRRVQRQPLFSKKGIRKRP